MSNIKKTNLNPVNNSLWVIILGGTIMVLLLCYYLSVPTILELSYDGFLTDLSLREQIATINDYRNSALGIITAVVISVALFFTYKRQLFLSAQLEVSQKQLISLQDAQLNDRFGKAIELLSNNRQEVRIGALITLEGICRQNSEYLGTVRKIIYGFISNRARIENNQVNINEKRGLDIEEALKIYFRLYKEESNKNYIFENICLRNINFSLLQFENRSQSLSFLSCLLINCSFGSDENEVIRFTDSVLVSCYYYNDNDSIARVRINRSLLTKGTEIDINKGKLSVYDTNIKDSTIYTSNKVIVSNSLIGNSQLDSNEIEWSLKNSVFDKSTIADFEIGESNIIDQDLYDLRFEEWINKHLYTKLLQSEFFKKKYLVHH